MQGDASAWNLHDAQAPDIHSCVHRAAFLGRHLHAPPSAAHDVLPPQGRQVVT